MLNIIFNRVSSKETFLLKDLIHRSLVGFEPYINGDIGIVDEDDPNSFILSIGDTNDSDISLVPENTVAVLPGYKNPKYIDKDFVCIPFDPFVQQFLNNAKEKDALFISSAYTIVDKTKPYILSSIRFFPEALKNTNINDVKKVFSTLRPTELTSFTKATMTFSRDDYWIRETKNEYLSSHKKLEGMYELATKYHIHSDSQYNIDDISKCINMMDNITKSQGLLLDKLNQAGLI